VGAPAPALNDVTSTSINSALARPVFTRGPGTFRPPRTVLHKAAEEVQEGHAGQAARALQQEQEQQQSKPWAACDGQPAGSQEWMPPGLDSDDDEDLPVFDILGDALAEPALHALEGAAPAPFLPDTQVLEEWPPALQGGEEEGEPPSPARAAAAAAAPSGVETAVGVGVAATSPWHAAGHAACSSGDVAAGQSMHSSGRKRLRRLRDVLQDVEMEPGNLHVASPGSSCLNDCEAGRLRGQELPDVPVLHSDAAIDAPAADSAAAPPAEARPRKPLLVRRKQYLEADQQLRLHATTQAVGVLALLFPSSPPHIFNR
jgi:hypothetical protein